MNECVCVGIGIPVASVWSGCVCCTAGSHSALVSLTHSYTGHYTRTHTHSLAFSFATAWLSSSSSSHLEVWLFAETDNCNIETVNRGEEPTKKWRAVGSGYGSELPHSCRLQCSLHPFSLTRTDYYPKEQNRVFSPLALEERQSSGESNGERVPVPLQYSAMSTLQNRQEDSQGRSVCVPVLPLLGPPIRLLWRQWRWQTKKAPGAHCHMQSQYNSERTMLKEGKKREACSAFTAEADADADDEIAATAA